MDLCLYIYFIYRINFQKDDFDESLEDIMESLENILEKKEQGYEIKKKDEN